MDLDLRRCADLGLRLFLFLALFTYAGYGLDQWLQTRPLWLVIGAILGLAGGMYHVVHTVLTLQQHEGQDDESP